MAQILRFFLDASGNYFEASFNTQEQADAYDDSGLVEVPQRPSSDHVWQSGAWVYVAPPPPVITAQDIYAERERRLAEGFDYDFGDARGVHHIGTSRDDMVGWDEVTQAANAMIALGNGSATIGLMTDTGPATVTALEWQLILIAAAQFRQPIWAASFALTMQNPIPADYADESYW